MIIVKLIADTSFVWWTWLYVAFVNGACQSQESKSEMWDLQLCRLFIPKSFFKASLQISSSACQNVTKPPRGGGNHQCSGGLFMLVWKCCCNGLVTGHWAGNWNYTVVVPGRPGVLCQCHRFLSPRFKSGNLRIILICFKGKIPSNFWCTGCIGCGNHTK